MIRPNDMVTDFIVAAVVPRDADHSSGTIERAEEILAAHPRVATAGIHTAAILGDDAAVRRFIALERASATTKGGPYGWDALTHLCFSNYLKHDRSRTDGFVRATYDNKTRLPHKPTPRLFWSEFPTPGSRLPREHYVPCNPLFDL